MQKEPSGRVIEVVVTWGEDYPLLATQVPLGHALRLGRTPSGAPCVLDDDTAATRTHDADSHAETLVDESGRVRGVPGGEHTLFRDGLGRTAAAHWGDGEWVTLEPGDALTIVHAGFHYWFRAGRAEHVRGVRALALPRWNSAAGLAMLGSLGLHLVFLVAGWLLPPSAAALSLDMSGEDARYARYLLSAAERTPPPSPDWLEPSDTADSDGGAAHEGAEGQAGDPEHSRTDKRMGVQKRPDDRAPTLARERIESAARSEGILGVLATHALSNLGPASPYGAAQEVGYDPLSALGALTGAEIGGNFGFGALGMRNTGRGGGGPGKGTIGAGPLGTRGVGPGAGGPFGNLHRTGQRIPDPLGKVEQLSGALSKEAIRRAIRRHVNEVRHCYEQGLLSRPDLAGRVSVLFTIRPDGSVGNAAVRESSVRDAAVEGCIVQAVRRWPFPRPENGGMVTVTYPFLLQSTGG